MSKDIPILYIIVRNDMASMTPGRQAAQATHAANQAVFTFDPQRHGSLLADWQRIEAGEGFGTTIVLAAEAEAITEIINEIAVFGDPGKLHAGTVVDPDYRIIDGSVAHSLRLVTAGFILGRRSDCVQYVAHLPLMP